MIEAVSAPNIKYICLLEFRVMKIEGNELKKWKGLRNWMEKAKKKKDLFRICSFVFSIRFEGISNQYRNNNDYEMG